MSLRQKPCMLTTKVQYLGESVNEHDNISRTQEGCIRTTDCREEGTVLGGLEKRSVPKIEESFIKDKSVDLNDLLKKKRVLVFRHLLVHLVSNKRVYGSEETDDFPLLQ